MKTERKDFYPTYGKMSYLNSPGGRDGLFLQTVHLPCGLDYGWACWFQRGLLEWVNGLLYLHTKWKFTNTWKQGPCSHTRNHHLRLHKRLLACVRAAVKVKQWSRSVVSNSATPRTVGYHTAPSMGFSSKSTGVGCHFLLQRIFPTQGLNPVSHIVSRCFTIWATREVQDM